MGPIRTTNMHFMNCILDAEDLEELDFALNGETPLYEAKFDRSFYLSVHDARGNDVTAALPELHDIWAVLRLSRSPERPRWTSLASLSDVLRTH